MIKSYSEMLQFETFEERFEYLKLSGVVGKDTFGWSRYLNQAFYTSYPWRKLRNRIIIRDNGCDLVCEDRPIRHGVYLHHINPITEQDLLDRNDCIFDPENLVCVSYNTHQMIHYGSIEGIERIEPIIREPNDTCPWKR